MTNGIFKIPTPTNEPGNTYAPGTKERETLKAELKRQSEIVVDIPVIINGQNIKTDTVKQVVMPHAHQHVLANYSEAGEKELRDAIEAAMDAKEAWANMPWEHRAAIFLKAADLISGPYRDVMNAATMLGQSKTAIQAEIDSAQELIDFLRFGVEYANQVYAIQPASMKNVWNRTDYRPLDGFVLAISPFNFTAIGGNLPAAPAMMGNVVVWKPATTSLLANYYFMRILEEAGLPKGVINFVPSRGSQVSEIVLTDSRMAGFHFTGSTATFQTIWKNVGENIANYISYPRLVGETGGKDFVFAHESAQADKVVASIVRGAFEYQGQKCSAASRAYIPASLWEEVKAGLIEETAKLKVGDVRDFRNFMGAVIDQASFDSIKNYIEYAKASEEAEIIAGGTYDDSVGYFVQPTIIVTTNPNFKTMVEEIFGPVLTIYVYENDQLEETLTAVDTASMYALTGAIFAQDRQAILHLEERLSGAAGNFYINDKPTGAMINQQPFGGSRGSGTNDKAGSVLNMIRWTTPRVIKENFAPTTDITYPFMDEE
ncbi:1-pyrroline-5-carboxylate dehydrogenase [Lysinibacillus composti]|uniref:L-glutamate gamma-semialdehyde dehydrogenase n=1 Tax=Lysinibacillus composti TaxID=720633 RepID=A0A3N9UAQ0_9BACI|nr:L-glutamate gamma-semialdehyde dehydrogenase [Lysinibacillus composti]MBM7609855.1 1-pyrroline-5-carboxylate dehydrogenase [Lysinibacillus composti]RQW73537.1 L-glutamate gamma-semialdehyde dehydrogenase [Lysinibacillus composti]